MSRLKRKTSEEIEEVDLKKGGQRGHGSGRSGRSGRSVGHGHSLGRGFGHGHGHGRSRGFGYGHRGYRSGVNWARRGPRIFNNGLWGYYIDDVWYPEDEYLAYYYAQPSLFSLNLGGKNKPQEDEESKDVKKGGLTVKVLEPRHSARTRKIVTTDEDGITTVKYKKPRKRLLDVKLGGDDDDDKNDEEDKKGGLYVGIGDRGPRYRRGYRRRRRPIYVEPAPVVYQPAPSLFSLNLGGEDEENDEEYDTRVRRGGKEEEMLRDMQETRKALVQQNKDLSIQLDRLRESIKSFNHSS